MKRIFALIAGLALVVAACSSSSDDGVATLEDGGAPLESAENVAAEGTDEEALLAFGACMRENGIPDFPDPVLNADGSVDFGVGNDPDPFPGVSDEVVEEAVTTCIDLLEGVAFGPGGVDFDLTEIEDRFVEFAACMRERGIDIDDPDFSALAPGGDGGLNPFDGVDFEDPEVLAALEECQGIFADLGFGG
ncbi:MAG: hypothetical protein QNJ71_08985 [Acidimicrobiia bacterium]|nr:hypothetical protein [Acidimicrobiia bacterium]